MQLLHYIAYDKVLQVYFRWHRVTEMMMKFNQGYAKRSGELQAYQYEHQALKAMHNANITLNSVGRERPCQPPQDPSFPSE